jgi:aphidicolan-16beta-ol synthase/syn-copalyl-diphosphate synthase
VLLVQSLTDVLQTIEDGRLLSVFDDDAKSRLAITLFQACFRPLLDQKTNGSWNNSIEETAYGILILSESRRLHLFEDLQQPIDQAISRGVNFLESNKDQPGSHIWIEKVSYTSPLVTQSYRLAAMRVASTQIAPSVGSSVWNKSQASGLHKHVELFSQAPLFSQLPRWELHGSMVEAALFAALLRTHRSAVFDRMDLEEDKYFDVIPFFWTSSNNRARTYASTSFLFEMSRIALLNFQVDEFMEATAGPTFDGRFDDLRDLIRDMLADDRPVPIIPNKSTLNGTNGVHESNGVHNSHKLKPLDLNDRDPGYIQVFTHLSKFLNYILQHQYVQAASAWDQQLLRRELRTYLLGHTQQAEDSSRSGKACEPVSTTTTTFFNWVRTTSADHISCPYSFAFVSCFMGFTLTPRGGGGDCFPSATEKYLANAVCRHLSTMCRMYNDLGSTERDQSEGNLNSVDFPEFGTHQDMKSKQKALLSLAEYERQAYIDAFARLEQARLEIARENADAEAVRLAERRMAIWTMFCEEVDLYGQVYVVRDISSRVLGGEQSVAKAIAAV